MDWFGLDLGLTKKPVTRSYGQRRTAKHNDRITLFGDFDRLTDFDAWRTGRGGPRDGSADFHTPAWLPPSLFKLFGK